MIILDTNVVSEPLRPLPDPRVMVWLNAQTLSNLFLTSITIFELQFGKCLLPNGRRKLKLEQEIKIHTDQIYLGRILAFDNDSALLCGQLFANSKQKGLNPKLADCQIASIALKHGFAVATRNAEDFRHEGLRVINPWAD